jgi:putative endonuclease
MSQTTIGAQGESRAAAYLVARGLSLVVQNLRNKGGEIDLVMREGAYTVFVEVKRRSDTRHGTGREAVTVAKQRRICSVALRYLAECGQVGAPVRFDVVEIHGERVTHLPNAFPYRPPARGKTPF